MGLFGNIFKKKKNEEPIKNVNTEVTGNDIIIAGKMIKEGEQNCVRYSLSYQRLNV